MEVVHRPGSRSGYNHGYDRGPSEHRPRDTFTEVSYSYDQPRGPGGRPAQPTLCGSCAGAVFGMALIAGATALLWFNEGDAVRAQAIIYEARTALGAPDAPSSRGIVHLSGPLRGEDILADEAFGVTAQGIELQRTTEVFLWREHQDKTTRRVPDGRGGEVTETTTTYRYTSGWESSGLDSARFKHESDHRNPRWDDALAAAAAGALSFRPHRWRQRRVTLDGLELSAEIVAKAERPHALAPEPARLRESGALDGTQAVLEGAHVYAEARCVQQPRVGCARVGWRLTPLAEVSLVARRSGGRLGPWPADGRSHQLALLSFGQSDAPSMLDAAASAQTLWTLVKRVGGLLLGWAGWSLLFGPAQ